jgi:hypothetical protein
VLSVAIGVALSFGPALVQGAPAEATTSTSKTTFISSLVSAAQKTQRKFGVPASVSMAQAIAASDWGTSSAVSKAKNYFDTPCSASMTASQFAKLADAQVGKPYVLGAEAAISNPDPPKFDCSELVQWLFGRSGNPITDLAASQYNVTKKVTGSPKVGDLVFLRNNPARANGIGHVAVLTQKLSSGEWRVIEARGHLYGVVRTTLSYWKQRSYYAGLRRYSKFVLANGESVAASASSMYQSGCMDLGSDRIGKFTSMTNSFYANAAAITEDGAYADARAVMSSVPRFVDALAKVVKPKSAADYARTINDLIDTYHLNDYNVVPIKRVFESGDGGSKVKAVQYLLKGAGYSAEPTGTFDSATVSAVKKLQKAKKLEVDGQVGQYTLTALFASLKSGATGGRAAALNSLLNALGYRTTDGDTFGSATLAAVKSFQATAGHSASGTVDTYTWSALFMSLDSVAPKLTGSARVGQTLSVDGGNWGPGAVSLSYQWYAGSKAISGATKATYDVQPTDAGSAIRVVVTGLKTNYTETNRSAETDVVDNGTLTATPTPKITGTAAVGATLTAVPGTWAPAKVALAYQWARDGKDIEGATASTYTLKPADLDATLTVSVTGSRVGYNPVTKTSAKSGSVGKGTLSVKGVKVSGTPKVGKTLTAEPGTWSPSGVSLSYQWYRGSSKINGATKSTYKLATVNKGKLVSVRVTATLDGYTTLGKQSAKVKVS